MNRLNQDAETLEELYSSAWSRNDVGQDLSAADFLADHPDASPSERWDVLLTEQWLRWRTGRPKVIGDYLHEHPSLADDPEAILKLVQGEFLARLERGEAPEPESYIRMFPALAEEIRLQCEVDRWLTMPPPPGPWMSMATTVDYRGGDDAMDDGHIVDSTLGGPVTPEAPLSEADFELVRLLGSGGMGEVYEAIQKSLRKRVALKFIRREALDSPSRVRRFFAEARALARLRHPHIVGVHGIGRMADGRYFLVMDLIEGGSTLAALVQQGTVSFDQAAGLVATVAEAIEHAHSRGVIHRDLKPSNVLHDAEGRPHVTDFGLAKVFDATDPDNPQTTADQILGTPHYMTPEQADPARGPIAPRTDVYALGGLLYALLTGKPPIQGDSLTAILTRLVSPEPVPSPRVLRVDVPVVLERICGTCLEKDAEKRYPSAGAVAVALRAWLANPEVEDSVGAGASNRKPTIRSGQEPGPVQPRSGWVTDRSFKDAGRTPSPNRWAARTALSAPSPRRKWAAGAGVSTLALLLAVAVFWARIDRSPGPMSPSTSDHQDVAANTSGSGKAREQAPIAAEGATSPLVDLNPTRTDPKKALARSNAERLYDAAVDAVRAGRPAIARQLLDQYLGSPEIERSDPARELLREINLATSIADARRVAAGLSDEELQESMRGVEARAASRIVTPELRIVYDRTLTQAFRQESDRRRSPQGKSSPPLAKSELPGPIAIAARVPAPAEPATQRAAGPGEADDPGDLDSAKGVGLAGGPPLPGDGALDDILTTPAKFAGQTRVVDGFYKVGTRLSEVKGPDGRPVGWSLPVARDDGGTICSGEAKVVGRDVYLVLEDGFAPFLKGIFETLKMRTTLKPIHKCILTVRVTRRGNSPVVEITGLEILGTCDLMKLINNQYDKAFTTVRIANSKAAVGYGDGAMWVQRLGGEEYIIRLRKRVRDLQRRMMADQNQPLVGRFLAAEMSRVMAMSSAAQAQQARALAGLIGRTITPNDR